MDRRNPSLTNSPMNCVIDSEAPRQFSNNRLFRSCDCGCHFFCPTAPQLFDINRPATVEAKAGIRAQPSVTGQPFPSAHLQHSVTRLLTVLAQPLPTIKVALHGHRANVAFEPADLTRTCVRKLFAAKPGVLCVGPTPFANRTGFMLLTPGCRRMPPCFGRGLLFRFVLIGCFSFAFAVVASSKTTL